MPVDARVKYAEIVDYYRKSLNVKKTADELGHSMQAVRRAIKQAGLTPSRARDGILYDNIDNLRQWIEDGLTLQEMGERLGSKRQTVHVFLKKHNIPYEKRGHKGTYSGTWKGGRIIDCDGYVLIKKHDHPRRDRHNYVREHRLVMEQILGRYLEPNEVVHHVNGDKQDNRPENLELFSSNPEHLAETLARQAPRWTAEGYAAMCAPRPRGPKPTPE